MSFMRAASYGERVMAGLIACHVRLAALSFLILISLLASSAAIAGDLDKIVLFHIEAGTLDKALLEFGAQAHVQIMLSSNSVVGRRTLGLTGSYRVNEALQKILKDTGLIYIKNGNTLLVMPETSRNFANHSAVALTNAPDSQRYDPPETTDVESVSRGKEQGSRDRGPDTLQEVTVLGTHIRGLAAAIGEQTLVITRDQIARSGYATTPQVMQTIPQNFAGGVSEAQSPISVDTTAGNFNRGTAVNLRGIGADSTLVLIDGHRVPGSGVNGAFTDVSDIPASAIERIEVLPDGASAVYGSDAVGGVVNFILRQRLNGGETAARIGTYAGASTETVVSQLLGHTWNSGSVLADYQYYHRGSLASTERLFSSSDNLKGLGGADYRSFDSDPGNILSPITGLPAFAIPAGQAGTGLTPGALVPGHINYFDSASTRDLLPEQTMHSAFLSVRQRIARRITAFSESRFNVRLTTERGGPLEQTITVPSSNAFFVDPFAGTKTVRVDYNFLQDFGTEILRGRIDTFTEVAGLELKLPEEWEILLSGNFGRERTLANINNLANTSTLTAALASSNPATAFNPFGDGSYTNPATLASVRAVQYERDHSLVNEETLTADGPLWRLPGGALRAALGADYRQEGVSGVQEFPGANSSKTLSRHVFGGFVELAIPVVGAANAMTGLRRLELSLAGRGDRYSDFGRTFNSKFGVGWFPTENVDLRVTWGTSFKPPRLIQLLASYPNAFDFPQTLASASGPIPSLVQYGNNPNLRQETADVWTAGVDYTGGRQGGPTIGATYWNIDYKNLIEAAGPPGMPFSILLNQSVWSSAITLNPNAAEIAAICNSPTFFGSVPGCLAGKYGAIVDLRLQNLAQLRVRGVDGSASYPWSGRAGAIRLGVQATYVADYLLQVKKGEPAEELANTIGNVPRFRARGSLSWMRGNLSAALYLNVTGRYTDNISTPHRSVGSWETADATFGYAFSRQQGVLSNVTVLASAVNALNHDPPFANVGSTSGGALGYDPANATPYGRILSLQITKSY